MLTGNRVSSSTTTPSKKKTDLPLYKQQGPVDKSTTSFQGDLGIVIDDIFESTRDILSEDSTDHYSGNSRPNIMPRPIGMNRGSLTSRMENIPPGFSHFTRNSTLSAFSTIGVSRKNVSPVPSMNRSDCSDSPFNNSTIFYSDNYPEPQLGEHHQQNLSGTSMQHYYFTPVQPHVNGNSGISYFNQGSGDNDHNTEYQSSQRSFPQCIGYPQSLLSSNDSGMKMEYKYTQHLEQNNFPMGHFNNMYSRVPVNYNSSLYCEPTVDLPKQESLLSLRKNKTQDSDIAGEILQSPARCREKSIGSLDSSEDGNGSSSPLPQNLKGDLHRQAKVKTELCLHFACGKKCPFGSRCNYAHGEDELKYTKLCELKDAGLVEDVATYRTHPCASWVSTGAW